MAQVPARLVYENSSNNDEVIGRFLPQDVTDGNISTFTISQDAEDYTRVIIGGAPELAENMPTTLSDFGTSEPEIRVEIDPDLDGNWTLRTRVYPEESGTENNRGRYKNKNLWGFKKYYGESDVDVTSDTTGPVTTNIEDVLDELLPPGYVAQHPGTPPSVTNYTFNGSRQQAFSELQRNYTHRILFTTDTDGSGDYIVRIEPLGFGSEQFSLVKRQDPLFYDYWKRADTSPVVSKVKVIGKNSSGDKVEQTVTASNPDRERFRAVHVDYTITSSEATDIANDIVQPDAVEHGAIETELKTSSNINDSVGILDDERNIDDVYTVVQQKDYLHQGVSYFSFEYEHESTKKQREKWREHDSERRKLYTDSSSDLTHAHSMEKGGTADTPSNTAISKNDGVKPANIELGEDAGSNIGNVVDETVDVTLSEAISFDWIRDGVEFREIVVTVEDKAGKVGFLRLQVNQYLEESNSSFITYHDDWHHVPGYNSEKRIRVPVLRAENEGTTIEGDIFVQAEWKGTNGTIESTFDFDAFATAETEHSHGDDFGTSDADHGGATIDNIVAVDTGNDIVTVGGDETSEYSSSNSRKNDIEIAGSTGNDGFYTVSSVSLNNNNNTEITVNEDITNSTADGVVIPEENHGLTGNTIDKILNVVAGQEDKTDR